MCMHACAPLHTCRRRKNMLGSQLPSICVYMPTKTNGNIRGATFRLICATPFWREAMASCGKKCTCLSIWPISPFLLRRCSEHKEGGAAGSGSLQQTRHAAATVSGHANESAPHVASHIDNMDTIMERYCNERLCSR
jgi:hypothetical protein